MDCHVGAEESQQLEACRGSQNTVAGGYCGQPTHVESERLPAQYVLMSSSLFLRRGARIDPAVTAVVADMVNRALVHPGVVNVVDRVDVHVIHGRVVEKMPVVPASALITMTEITEAIVDPTIKTYERAPVALIEKKSTAAPTPIARSPEVADFAEPSPMCPVPSNSRRQPKPSIQASRYSRRPGKEAARKRATQEARL